MKNVTLITDGACNPNPGAGGWAVILRYGEKKRELWGHAANTTNNRMEMQALIEGLSALKERCQVTVRTDSKLVITLCEKTGHRWLSGKRKKAPKNTDLLERMMELQAQHDVRFEWVRGHCGDPDNERADYLAESASRRRAV